jgi:hypothetical protein
MLRIEEGGISRPGGIGGHIAPYPLRPETTDGSTTTEPQAQVDTRALRDYAWLWVVPGANACWRRFASCDCQ